MKQKQFLVDLRISQEFLNMGKRENIKAITNRRTEVPQRMSQPILLCLIAAKKHET